MNEEFVRNRINELRTQKKLSERQMSLDLGHSPSYMNGISAGKMPSVAELLYIIEYLGITPESFFKEDKSPTILQQRAIDLIYELKDDDTEFVIGVIERIHHKK